MNEIKNFYSDKNLTRFEYFKRTLLLVGILIAGHILYMLRFSNRNTSPTTLITFEIIGGAGLLFWMLTNKIVTQIQLDFINQKFIAHYITLFSDKKKLEVPLECLTYSFNKQPSIHHPKNWTLRIFNKEKKVFSIGTDDDGFPYATLERIAEELKKYQDSLG